MGAHLETNRWQLQYGGESKEMSHLSHRVIGGKEAKIMAWPWIISIRVDMGAHLETKRWQHQCEGESTEMSQMSH